MDWSTFQEVPI